MRAIKLELERREYLDESDDDTSRNTSSMFSQVVYSVAQSENDESGEVW